MGNLVFVFPSRGNLKWDLQQQVLSLKILHWEKSTHFWSCFLCLSLSVTSTDQFLLLVERALGYGELVKCSEGGH